MLKTKLPTAIHTVDQAKVLLTDLYNNNESFHPEDNAHEVGNSFNGVFVRLFTPAECDQLNKLMEDIYNLSGNDGRHCGKMIFDPCLFLLLLADEYYIPKLKSGVEFFHTANNTVITVIDVLPNELILSFNGAVIYEPLQDVLTSFRSGAYALIND